MAASAQIANHFGLVSSVASGMTDAKTMDAEAGYEKGITITAAALAGGNLVSAYPGIVGSLMGQSFEGMVIDHDLIGNTQRLLRGIEVPDETLSFETIRTARSAWIRRTCDRATAAGSGPACATVHARRRLDHSKGNGFGMVAHPWNGVSGAIGTTTLPAFHSAPCTNGEPPAAPVWTPAWCAVVDSVCPAAKSMQRS